MSSRGERESVGVEPTAARERASVLGVPIDALSWEDALARILGWAERRESRVVCICNVHSVVTARQDPYFGQIVANADLATPDGAPVAWVMRQNGYREQQRINGPDLMWRLLERVSAQSGPSVYFYGSSEDTLRRLRDRLQQAFPALRVAGWRSPPFRSLSAEEMERELALISESGAGLVFVGLGCPKQEIWMSNHRGKVSAAMIGVGAAFDYHAGVVKRAPLWMQRNGLEWLHRLMSEPRRLWRRYLFTNTAFVWAVVLERLGFRKPTA